LFESVAQKNHDRWNQDIATQKGNKEKEDGKEAEKTKEEASINTKERKESSRKKAKRKKRDHVKQLLPKLGARERTVAAQEWAQSKD
jgi:hypothetical protein